MGKMSRWIVEVTELSGVAKKPVGHLHRYRTLVCEQIKTLRRVIAGGTAEVAKTLTVEVMGGIGSSWEAYKAKCVVMTEY